MIIFLIINLQQIILNLKKFKITIKINHAHLIEIEQQNWKIEQLKFNKIMQKLLQ